MMSLLPYGIVLYNERKLRQDWFSKYEETQEQDERKLPGAIYIIVKNKIDNKERLSPESTVFHWHSS
jgi:hypothetical protein